MATRSRKTASSSRAAGGARRGSKRIPRKKKGAPQRAASSARPGSSAASRTPHGRRRRGAPRGKAASRAKDALDLLKSDHEQVSRLFDDFERAAHARGGNGLQRKTDLATEICRQLQLHAVIEEEVFYPAASQAIEDDELIPEATVEHQSAKDLIGRIERMDPEDELYDATVMVLGEYIRHHVREEEQELFPRVRRSQLDLRELGTRMRDLRTQALAL